VGKDLEMIAFGGIESVLDGEVFGERNVAAIVIGANAMRCTLANLQGKRFAHLLEIAKRVR